MKIFSLLLLCITLVSCTFERKPHGSFFEYVSESDTTCLNEISQAKNDLEKGKLTYCHYSGNLIHYYLRSEKELIDILRENKIDFKNEGSSCVVYENQTEHCYCELMREKINEKYGEQFVDSLLNIADEKYLVKHINDTMYYANCDSRPKYPFDGDDNEDEHSVILQKEIDQTFVYPKGYIKRPNYDVSAFVDISFYVDKFGDAQITSFRFQFGVKSNHKFEEYFERELNKIIKTKGWKPAQIRKQNVNSDMVLRYGFK